jgi:hypothetical protein
MKEATFILCWAQHVRQQEVPRLVRTKLKLKELRVRVVKPTPLQQLPPLLKPKQVCDVESVIYHDPKAGPEKHSGFIVIEPVKKRRVFIRYELVERVS